MLLEHVCSDSVESLILPHIPAHSHVLCTPWQAPRSPTYPAVFRLRILPEVDKEVKLLRAIKNGNVKCVENDKVNLYEPTDCKE